MIPPAKNPKIDMFGNLPDGVILHILSFLNSEEAVQTCILSVRWKDFWKYLPGLKFHKPYHQNSTIFAKSVSNLLSLRHSAMPLHTLDFKHEFGILDPKTLNNTVNYAISRNVQRVRLSVTRYNAQIPNSLCSSQTLTHLKISISYEGIAQISLNLPALTHLNISIWTAHEGNLFPKSLYLPALTTLQLEHFTFLAADDDRAEPFSTFNSLKTLLVSNCTVKGARTLYISNATLVNLSMHNYSNNEYDQIDICTPSLSTFAFHGIPYQNISGINVSSLKHVAIHAKLFPYSGRGDPLFIFNWLLEFANITSLTVTATTLQVLSLIRRLLNFNFPSLGKLKSLKVKVDKIQYEVRMKLYKDKLKSMKKAAKSMKKAAESMKKATKSMKKAAKSMKNAAKIRKAYIVGHEPSPLVPDGILNFLLQNCPSVEVDLVDCTNKLP